LDIFLKLSWSLIMSHPLFVPQKINIFDFPSSLFLVIRSTNLILI
jgi:hypothetical protein